MNAREASARRGALESHGQLTIDAAAGATDAFRRGIAEGQRIALRCARYCPGCGVTSVGVGVVRHEAFCQLTLAQRADFDGAR